jgi:GDP-L-fucose synthase
VVRRPKIVGIKMC